MSLYVIKAEDLRKALKIVEATGEGATAIFESGDGKLPMNKRFMTLVGVTPPEEKNK